MRRYRFIAVFLIAAFQSGCSSDQGQAALRDFRQDSVVVTHGGDQTRFRVWIADSIERHRQGLKFIRDMPRDQGMLFLYPSARSVLMWMKNTYLSLDIIFVAEGGVVSGIEENTTPFSLEIIPSPGPVIGILELNAGEALRRGIRPGARVNLSSVLKNSEASPR